MSGDAARRLIPGTWFRIAFTAARVDEDELTGLLFLHGAEGWQTAPAGPRRIEIQAWFSAHDPAARALHAVCRNAAVRARSSAPQPLQDSGWLEATLRPRGALAAGRFVVRDVESTAIATAAAEQIEIYLPPGRAFGTGEHATTALCLELLGELGRSGDQVLDLGTGSGILAIGAAKLGAAQVLALDNDPETIPVAAENLALNGVSERVELRAGSLREVGRRRFDLILANIHRTALLRGARGLSARLAAGGCAILSGFPTVDAALVETAWQSCDGRVVSHRTRGDWSALQWRRAGAP